MTVLLTGATGFLGRRILLKLREAGHKVRVLVRSPEKLGVLAADNDIEVLKGDLTDPEAIQAAVKGVDRIYHVAAAVTEWPKDWKVFDRVNVTAWENLIKASMEQHVSRIVYTSSFMALGSTDNGPVCDETLVRESGHFHNPYERTKVLGRLLTTKYIEKGAPIIQVCPGVIFGPGELTEGNLLVGMIRDMINGKFPGIPGNGEKLLSMAYIEDVAAGHLAAMEKGIEGETYILAGENITLNDLVDKVAQRAPIKKQIRHLPMWFASSSATVLETLAKIFHFRPQATKGRIEVFRHHWAYSSTKAEKYLGYAITPFDNALTETMDWMVSQGLIKR